MPHALTDLGEFETLWAIVTNRKDLTNASVDAINLYYSRPAIPIGTDQAGPAALNRARGYIAALHDDIGPES